MERRWKKELTEYFEAPTPKKKKEFVRKCGLQKMDLLHVVAMQAKYISNWVWLFSALFFGIALAVSQIADSKYVCVVLALVPFLVLLSVSESIRSYRYGMEELELSTRFSLKSIVLARMLMLGFGNLVVLTGALLLLKNNVQMNIVYIMTPYFLTAGGSLYIVRNMRGTESTLPCLALASIVCVLEFYLPRQFENIFVPQNLWIWGCVCMVSVVLTVRESYRTIRMTEVLV